MVYGFRRESEMKSELHWIFASRPPISIWGDIPQRGKKSEKSAFFSFDTRNMKYRHSKTITFP